MLDHNQIPKLKQQRVEDDSSPRSFQKEKFIFPESPLQSMSFTRVGSYQSGVDYSLGMLPMNKHRAPIPSDLTSSGYSASTASDSGHTDHLVVCPVPTRPQESRITDLRHPSVISASCLKRELDFHGIIPQHMGHVVLGSSFPVRQVQKLPELSLSNGQENFDPVVQETVARLLDKQPLNKINVEKLTSSERWLVRALIKKIFNIVLSDPVDSLDFVDIVNENRDKGRCKRLEEELKVVFKKTMKYLLTRYKTTFDAQDIPDTPKKFDFVVGFYKKYFEDVYNSDSKFREFFKISDPDKSLNEKKLNSQLIHPLTVNAQHIGLVMKSVQFRQEAIEYIEKKLLQDYEQIRELKIKKILKKFYEVMSKDTSREAIDCFIGNSQTKLPWSTKDLLHAIKNFMDIIKRSEHSSGSSSA